MLGAVASGGYTEVVLSLLAAKGFKRGLATVAEQDGRIHPGMVVTERGDRRKFRAAGCASASCGAVGARLSDGP